MKTIIINSPKLEISSDVATISSEIVLPDRRFELYFRGSTAHISAYGGDAFLVACLPTAMKLKLPITVECEVSAQLLQSISTAQDIFLNWNSHFAKIEIHAKPRTSPIKAASGSAAFFSGGVDSFYTAYKHIEHISALVLVHGFDISLENRVLRDKVSGALHDAAAALGKPLIEIETNGRKLTDGYVSWIDHQFGPALAAVAILLNPVAGRVFIPASESYAHLEPCGSHPLLDPLWSTEYLEIIYDGGEYSRNQKVAEIARHPEVLRRLRVCWENPEDAYNCGRCEKCIRTMINLETANALARCTAFEAALDPAHVAEMRISHDLVYFHVQENLRVLKEQGREDALVSALEASVARYRSEKLTRELSAIEQLFPSPDLGVALNRHSDIVLQSLASQPGRTLRHRLLKLLMRFLG